MSGGGRRVWKDAGLQKGENMEKRVLGRKTGRRRGSSGVLYGKYWKRGRLLLVICLLSGIALFPGGCGKHKCVICGEEADGTLKISGKEFHICGDCYETYIEIPHLFEDGL